MTVKRLVSGLLALSIVLAALPARAETEGGSSATAQGSASSTFRASLDRAAAAVSMTPMPESQGTAPFGTSRRTMKRSESASEEAGGQAVASGGGGSHVLAIVMTLVGTAAGVGATVYMLKQMKKIQDTAK
jgi:hypothetical protein